MDTSTKRISRSPAFLMVTGFSAGVVVVATLTLGGQVFTKKGDPIFDAPSGIQSGPLAWAGPPNSSIPSLSPTPTPPIAGARKVASLGQLLPGLEAKVAANPDDADLQILLAQTYIHLDQEKKARELLHNLQQQFPENDHIPFVRAQMLMESDAAADLQKAIHLFEEGVRKRPATLHLARLYQGQILVKLRDRERAIKVWRDFISTLPLGDERRTLMEAELVKITSRQNKNSL